MKKFLFNIIVFLSIFVLIIFIFFNRVTTINPELIEEYNLKQEFIDVYGDDGYCYFFVQSDEHYCFNGNGIDEIKLYAPEFDLSRIDTNKNNYIIAINCKINSLSYSYKSAYKTMSIGIDTYVSNPDLTKTYDNKVRIYIMKKVNIDYDFKKYGPHGVDFQSEGSY